MSDPWIPWDATEEEITELHIVREQIPESIRPAILAWIFDRLPGQAYMNEYTPSEVVDNLRTALRLPLDFSPKASVKRLALVEQIASQGDRTVLRVVDYLASSFRRGRYGETPPEIADLAFHLDKGGSAVRVRYSPSSPGYRLELRLVEGTEELAQQAVDQQESPGRHLSRAWRSAFDLDPNPSFAMTEAIRAVEAACAPVVLPKDRKPTLGKVVSALQSQSGWGLLLDNSDGFPNHLDVLIGMMETLAKAQPDRHAGEEPTQLQAQAHVQLAATLVFWFSSGAVLREQNRSTGGR